MTINRTKREYLQNMKVFVLDNSLRESNVGQVVGHSLEDKRAISAAAAKCGFDHRIVASFANYRRVDDAYCEEMIPQEYDPSTNLVKSNRYVFTEAFETRDATGTIPIFGPDHIPIGLQKMKAYKIPHAIIEIDLDDGTGIDFDTFTVQKYVAGLVYLLTWARDNLPNVAGQTGSNNLINLRDFPLAMVHCPDRVVEMVSALAKLPSDIRPMGMIYEEPMGEYFPEEMGDWSKLIRDAMDNNGWTSRFQQDGTTYDGLLLVHVHKQWGMADAVVLDCLAKGADGMWCSVSEEGAAMGHACSAVTLTNLARLGNTDIVTRYQTQELADSARAITRAVTNRPAPERQIVYGPRAIEAVFGFGGIAGGTDANLDLDGDGVTDHFSLAKFLGIPEPPIRVSTLASADMVVKSLRQWFGDSPEYTVENASTMLTHLRSELEFNVEMEHTSAMGLAALWQSCFQTMPLGMRTAFLVTEEPVREKDKQLLSQAKECFYGYVAEGEHSMNYKSFYDAYLQPFMGCFVCQQTRFVLDSIDLDSNRNLVWREWRFWCLWGLRSFPTEIGNIDDLHAVVLRNAIIPNSIIQGKDGNSGVKLLSADAIEASIKKHEEKKKHGKTGKN